MEDKLTSFKEYVKKNPSFIYYVKNNETTWQALYELYDLYGENSDAFDRYLKKDTSTVEPSTINNNGFMSSVAPVLEALKGLDMNTVQKGIDSLQKGIGLLQELITKDAPAKPNTYTPRPVGKYFDD